MSNALFPLFHCPMSTAPVDRPDLTSRIPHLVSRIPYPVAVSSISRPQGRPAHAYKSE